MRSVTFVDRLTLEVEGTVAQNGVCLADVDCDGDHELVVGTEAGELYIFKVRMLADLIVTGQLVLCKVQTLPTKKSSTVTKGLLA